MKKYFLPIAIMLCTLGNDIFAGTVTVSDAQSVALNFYKINTVVSVPLSATLRYTHLNINGVVDFYAFDVNEGFVIVAADDNVIPVLGYSTEGNFKTGFGHSAFMHWVSITSTNIRLALQSNVVADARISGQWSAYRQGLDPNAGRSGRSVAPLCATTWDQENDIATPPPYLYNTLCPYNTTDAQRALTGCVATAMAQIMKRWDYPAHGTGSYSYVDTRHNGYSNNYGTQSSDFAAHTYQWTAMPNVLDGTTETAAQDTAVGVLMYDCAVSVGMDFGDDNEDGSGANGLLGEELATVGDSICSQTALVWYFGYDADTIRGVVQSNYSSAAWIAMIEHEMDMHRPVLYEGDDYVDADSGGHAWVCDGYNSTDMLHMNWGWGGYENGYFAINNFTTSGPFNPVQDGDALIGIMPKNATLAGISSISQSPEFAIYPNPAGRQLMLQTSEVGDGATWSIRNLLGQTVLSGTVESAQTAIDMSAMTNGIYLVELQHGNTIATKKLVIGK